MSRSSERDRTLSRVRTTSAVTGIGAVLAGGVLAGWLGHEATQSTSDGSSTSPSSSSDDAGSGSGSVSGSDDGLSGPSTLPDAGSGSDSGQPGITSGGS